MCFLSWFVSEQASHLGDLLTGIAAVATLVVVAFAAPREIEKWRRQEFIRKQAEIAGKTLTTVIRFFQAIDHLTSAAVDAPKDAKEELGEHRRTYRARKDYLDRLNITTNDVNAFILVWNEAEVYLTNEVNVKLEHAWKEWVSAKVSIPMWISAIDNNDPDGASSHFDTVFGSDSRRRRERLKDEIKAMLKPIARLEADRSHSEGK